jgi:acetyl-CoA carboxylase biotin carboxyl carrier protein
VDDDKRLAAAIEGDVRGVLRAIAGSAVEEICFERGDVRIMLKRAIEAVPSVATSEGGVAPHPATAPPVADEPKWVEVRSGQVGFFHRSREPGGQLLAEEGARVEAGQAIGVIETLGMSADVEAPAAGTLAELRVQDGQPVDFGQVLAIVAFD